MRSIFLAALALCAPLAAAELKFETKLRELKIAADEAKAVTEFPFKNESSEDVEIVEYSSGCSCLSASISPSGKLVYKPGESGVIRSEFELSALAGTVDKAVAIRLKGDPKDQPSVILTTRIHIPVLVEMEPKTLFWNLGEEAKPKSVTLTMKHTEPIKVVKISGADSRFSQELKTIEEGKKYEITVTPASTANVAMGVIHIETDCKLQRHRSQRVFMVVRRKAPATDTAAKP
jgi:hypothetical protein